MQQTESIDKLAEALAAAQGEITGALKDSANPFFKSKYADLASCWDACRSALSKNGLAVVQAPTTEAGETYLVTILMHSSGQSVRSSLKVQPAKDDMQAMGSALTYARRYALTAMVGVAQVDDDGNAASGRSNVEMKVTGGGAEGHSPKGDLGKHTDPDQAFATAAAMRDILEADYQEDVRTIKVADKHDILNKDPDLYVAASENLKAFERAAWKKYVAMAKAKTLAEPPGRRF